MLKFISTCKNDSGRATRISVEGGEYIIPIDAFYIRHQDININIKVTLDPAGNVANVITSIYKLKILRLILNKDNVVIFDKFVRQFNTKSIEKTIDGSS
jgi:hypothetical protein